MPKGDTGYRKPAEGNLLYPKELVNRTNRINAQAASKAKKYQPQNQPEEDVAPVSKSAFRRLAELLGL